MSIKQPLNKPPRPVFKLLQRLVGTLIGISFTSTISSTGTLILINYQNPNVNCPTENVPITQQK